MKTLSLTFVFAFLIAGFSGLAQTSADLEMDLRNPEFRKKYENIDFKGNFSMQVLKDNTNNYFVVDFSSFKEKFERVYFLSLIFQNGKVVNIDSDINRDKVWFLSHISNSTEEVNSILKDLKLKTIEKSSSLSPEEKASWLKENDKYK